jgi:type I restriction enzyme S subunit
MVSETALSSKYRAYSEYKDTNVFWLRCIPEHWVLSKLKFVKDIIPNAFVDGPFGSNLKSSHIVEGGDVYVIESNFATQGILDKKKLKTITLEHFETICRSEAREGDIIIAKIGAQFGKASILPSICKRAVVSGNSLKLSINEVIFSKLFAHYVLLFLKESGAFDDIVNATAQPALSLGDLNNIHFPFPLLSEQQKIANFLDYETAKIDTLIAKQQQLITLLKEKRQAVISHAVTKGLNPNAPMRDSGVEWLGEVPEHWDDVSRIKYISSLKGRQGWQGLKAEEYLDEGPYVVSSAHFTNHQIQWDNCPRVSPERYERDSNIQLSEDDLLLMKDGAAMGKLAYVDELPDKACLNSHLLLFRPINRNDQMAYSPRFMYYFMQTEFFQAHIKIYGTGVTFLGISQQAIGNYRLVFPPLSEQQEITEFLESETEKLDELAQKQQDMMFLLLERRTALISAAVTGKIDVRNLQPPHNTNNNKEVTE